MKVPVKIINREKTNHLSYRNSMQIGLILSLSISIFAVKVDFSPPEQTQLVSNTTQEIIFMEEVVQTKQELKAPVPPRPAVPIEVPNDEILEVEILNIDAEFDLGDTYEIPPPPKSENTQEIEEEIFVVVEQPPVLIGGINSVQQSIKYPPLALQAGIEGRVIVEFIIDRDGNVVNPKLIRGIGGGCDEEAIRAVKEAKFKPGMQRGRAVQVRYTLPISFKLKSNSDGV